MNKLLIIGKDYYPDQLGVSKYTTEMAEWLAQNNYKVNVITGHPYYPDWKYRGNKSPCKYIREMINNIEIIRVPLYIPVKPNGIGRTWQNISFALFSLPVLLYYIIFLKPSSIITLVPSYSNSFFSVFLGKLFRIKTIVHVQDLEFDLAKRLMLLPEILFNFLFLIERVTLSQTSIITSISIRMLNELRSKINTDVPTLLFPNWIDKKSIYPNREIGLTFRESLNIGKDDFLILYAGNIGFKQGFDIIINLAEKLKDNDEVKLLIVGTGASVEDLKNIIHNKKLNNVTYLKPVENETLNKLLNAADLHIVLQKKGIDNYILPSKITNILGVGGNIFVTGSDDSEISDLIAKYPGIMYMFDNNNLDECINNICEIIKNRNSKIINNIALEYASQHLDKEVILPKFAESVLLKNIN